MARALTAESGPGAFILALRGDLGGGKTCFAAGLARGLGVKEKISSPTFVILKKYDLAKNKKRRGGYARFFHIDSYRLRSAKEMAALGFADLAAGPANIILIEWAGIIKDILPRGAVWMDFEFLDERSRRIAVSGSRRFLSRLPVSC